MVRTLPQRIRAALVTASVAGLVSCPAITGAQPVAPQPGEPPEPSAAETRDTAPGWVERLLFNPRERTARAIRAMQGEGSAVGPSESAMRLRPGDALSTFNAGTARLGEARADATPLLESATASAPPPLAARAAYNLGNALRDQSDLPGAIDAYRQALRQDPSLADAKFNLELARKLLEQQQQDQQNQQDQPSDDQQEQGDQEQQDQQNQDGEQDQEQQDQDQDQQDQDQQQQDQDQEQQDQQDQQQQDQQDQQQQDGQQPDPRQQGAEEQPLPQFENLEDMTAEEAAAILEAVENLEREARRQEALAATQANARGKKDW